MILPRMHKIQVDKSKQFEPAHLGIIWECLPIVEILGRLTKTIALNLRLSRT